MVSYNRKYRWLVPWLWVFSLNHHSKDRQHAQWQDRAQKPAGCADASVAEPSFEGAAQTASFKACPPLAARVRPDQLAGKYQKAFSLLEKLMVSLQPAEPYDICVLAPAQARACLPELPVPLQDNQDVRGFFPDFGGSGSGSQLYRNCQRRKP